MVRRAHLIKLLPTSPGVIPADGGLRGTESMQWFWRGLCSLILSHPFSSRGIQNLAEPKHSSRGTGFAR